MFKIYRYLLKLSPLQLISRILIAFLIINLLFGSVTYILVLFTNLSERDIQAKPFSYAYGDWFFSVLMAPILETIIFQAFIILGSKRIFPGKNLRAIIISSIIFGAMHYSSPHAIVRAFVMGVVLATCFEIASKKSLKFAFQATIFVHFVWNLVSVSIKHVIFAYQ